MSEFTLKCILGCRIQRGKAVIPLECLHFICSNECANRVKAENSGGSSLQCKSCSSVIRPEQLIKRMIPSKVLEHNIDMSKVTLLCKYCKKNNPATAYCTACAHLLCKNCEDVYCYHHSIQDEKDHVLQRNLTEQKVKKMEELKEAEKKCRQHKDVLVTDYCVSCALKMCSRCLPNHVAVGHTILNMDKENKKLETCIKAAKTLVERKETLEAELQKATAKIDKEFAAIMRTLREKKAAMETPVKEDHKRKLEALTKPSAGSDFSQASSERFISVARHMLNNGADAFAFTRQYRGYMDWLSRTSQKFAGDVYKDYRINVDLSSISQAQECLSVISRPENGIRESSGSTNASRTPTPVPVIVSVTGGYGGVSTGGSRQASDSPGPSTLSSASGSRVLSSTSLPGPSILKSSSEISRNFASLESIRQLVSSKRHPNPDVRAPQPQAPKKTRQDIPACSVRLSRETIGRSEFQDAPESSIEYPPCDEKEGTCAMRCTGTNEDENEDRCSICLDGGKLVLCDGDDCNKSFHHKCHIPVISGKLRKSEPWYCNWHTTKLEMEANIQSTCPPEVPGSENCDLKKSNGRHFTRACKFVMECYKIPEIPTMRWGFPPGHEEEFGKVPFHMNFIRQKLCGISPDIREPFSGVEEMLRAFSQMFLQAHIYYKVLLEARRLPEEKFLRAKACFEKFLKLLDDYYPGRRGLFLEATKRWEAGR